MVKAINRFDPVRSKTLDEAERHYVEIHHTFAREMHRRNDAVLQYLPARAVGQYDINGEFDQTPDAWRYVIHLRRDDLPDAHSFLPESDRQTIWTDHTQCIRNIRGLEVQPETVLDRCTGQMVFVKYLFEFHAEGSEQAEAKRHYVGQYLPRLKALLGAAFGFRKCVSNKVIRQVVTAPLQEEGQIVTGEYVEPVSAYRIDEFWFDNVAWGGDFFRNPATRALLRDKDLGRMEGYFVEEKCGVDKL